MLGKAGENSNIDASNKETTPEGAAIDNSGHNQSTAFAGILTHKSQNKDLASPPHRSPCLHGYTHLPTSLTSYPPFFLYPD